MQAWPREHEFADVAVLAAEVRGFAKASGAPEHVLPTARALTLAGRQDLLQVLQHQCLAFKFSVVQSTHCQIVDCSTHYSTWHVCPLRGC